jgi:hypothetical protein
VELSPSAWTQHTFSRVRVKVGKQKPRIAAGLKLVAGLGFEPRTFRL